MDQVQEILMEMKEATGLTMNMVIWLCKQKWVNILFRMALKNEFQLHMITVSFLCIYTGLRDQSTV